MICGVSVYIFALFTIIFGAVCCFWGYRAFRVVLGIIGFMLGVYLAASLVAHFTGGFGIIAIIAGIVGGMIGASLVMFLYYVGVFILGMLGGWALGALLAGPASLGISLVIPALVAIAGGVLAIIFQRFIIIVSTALLGSWGVVSGVFYFLNSGIVPMDIFNGPSDLLPVHGVMRSAMLLCWLVLALVGIVFQFSSSKRKKVKEAAGG